MRTETVQNLYLPEEYKKRKTDRKNRKQKLLCIAAAVLIGMILTGSVVRAQGIRAQMQRTQQDLAEEVFRFHVLANSDAEADQALKMKVKETVLSYMKESLPESESAEITKNWAAANIGAIEQTAREVVRGEGYSYSVHAEVTKCDFPDKTYGDVTFPAGRYTALRIEIGEAEGHNWWCVLYPNLCFLDSVNAVVPDEGKEELKEVLTDEEYEMVTAGSSFKLKWFFFGGR